MFGEPPYEWQPSRTVEPTYGLLPQDDEEYAEFLRRAKTPVVWAEQATFASEGGEPDAEKVRALPSLLRWARVDGELWLLLENVFAYFPDPLPYELHVKSSRDERFRFLGHFGMLPSCWQNVPQRPGQ